MRVLAGVALAVCCAATPAFAQSMPPGGELPSPAEIASKDTITVGLGAGIAPDYEGSDDYRFIPGGAIRGRVKGISFSTRGLSLFVDVVPDGDKFGFDAGPIAGVRLNRTRDIDDNIVDLLPERNKAIELGGFAGVSFKGLTNP